MALVNNAKDHWAFLEEIEAPMWVDFTVEEKFNYQDVDDKWFHTSHPFHQCTSRQLKVAFAHSSERSMSSDFEFKGSSSPNIPSSVSRSRGKHYAGKKWGGGECDLSMTKKHPVKVLNDKSSRVNSESSDEIKPKLSFANSKGTSRSKLSTVSGKSFTGIAKETDLKAKSGQGGSESSSNSGMAMVSDSNTSTVTFGSGHQARQGNMEVLSRGFDHTSGLLSAVRNGLRKSFVTRKASRVDKQLRDRKSSSSKSSVGSSLNNGYDVKSSTLTLMRKKEQTPDSRNVARMTEAARKKTKDSNMSKTSDVRVKEKVFNSRKGAISNVSKSAPQEALKSEVQKQTLRVTALAEHRGNKQRSLPGTAKSREKVRVSRLNKMVAPGKENVTGKMSLSQNCSSRGTKLNVPQKGDKTVLL
ncbi:PREDICTED: uncharacterized protein LOC105129150 [Populus euphratica]|uniref:Uncharacterized protein LOC105129150 n=1 Tax=Populus euphratica TaxID=75702 RepID=A0AAJ6UH44_POPEU|nr:PREDICTED: uncharacterized protein LOC105129150 [Populus euphratica]XP_011029397.1 PREDICTED: uncharacterized protein LOC105129150 [Populus euphratica]XP_011029398.1 PREDICTED: uncharacterized protein LOC105129150 [Populus euphratica]XP_011029399.1 PREDICTED: uncharacterized protein LOC105129150 [Populus euphratica]